MEDLTAHQVDDLIAYFRENVIEQDFNKDGTIYKMVVKNEADFDKMLESAELSWNNHREYPEKLKWVVVNQDGSKSGSFEYMAPYWDM